MSPIADLIQKRQRALAEVRDQEEKEKEAFLEAAAKQVEEMLGDYRNEFVPFWHPEDYGGGQKEGAHLPNYMSWRIEHPTYGVFRLYAIVRVTGGEGKLVPHLVDGDLYVQVHPVINGGAGRACLNNASAIADFFIGRLEVVQKGKEEVRQKAIHQLDNVFKVHASHYTRELVGDLVGEVLAVAPEKADEYRQAYTEWLKRKDEVDAVAAQLAAQEAAAEAEAAEKNNAKQAYWDALHEWDRERHAIREANHKALAEMQPSYDQVFNLYELAYALTGLDGDGMPFAEVSTVYVLEDAPREGGWWQVWDQGKQKITPMQFFTPVALVYCGKVAPSRSPAYLSLKPVGVAKECAIRTTPWWWTRKDELLAKIEAAMQPAPAAPDAAAFGLTEAEGQRLRQQFADVC